MSKRMRFVKTSVDMFIWPKKVLYFDIALCVTALASYEFFCVPSSHISKKLTAIIMMIAQSTHIGTTREEVFPNSPNRRLN